MSTGVAEGAAGFPSGSVEVARFSGARLASYAVAALVHLGTLAVLAAAVSAAITVVPRFWGVVIAAPLLGIAWLMRPRLGALPAEGLVTRGEAPTLYGLCDDVARAYGHPAVSYVVVDSGFDAAASAVGWRRRRVIRLGLPLVAALPAQARVALVASRLAPERTRGSHGLFIRSAMGALDEWCRILAPQERRSIFRQNALIGYRTRAAGSVAGGLANAGTPVANAIVWILGRPAVWLLRLETRLVSRDAELSAYRADLQACEVAGRKGMVDMYERLRLARRFLGLVRQEALNGREGLLSRVNAALDAFEVQRGGDDGPVDEPPTPGQPSIDSRIQMLDERGSTTTELVLDGSRSAAIDRELELRAPSVESDLYEWYRSSLYR